MELHITLDDRRDLTGSLYRQLRDAVLDGRLRAGEALPPTRELARRLAVSRGTVSVVYERLAAEGYLEARVGAGTFVRESAVPTPARRPSAASPLRPREVWTGLRAWPDRLRDVPYDLRAGLPDTRLFPYESWRRLVAGELRPKIYDIGDPAGLPVLREAIARHAGVSRSVRASASDVVVTSGIQQALDLIGRVLLEPGDVVAVEDPGYPPAATLFRSQGLRVTGVPVDAEGLRVDALPPDARAVYLTPSHQFPMGMPMSLPRRRALLDWARRRDVVVIEDDYDTEFRYGGRPVEPLQSLDEDGRVLYLGTFSKLMRPVLRLGYLVAPPALHEALRMARHVTSWHGDPPVQAALARFIDEGLLARHIRRSRRVYEERHEHIAAALAADFADRLTPIPSAAGLHLSATLSGPSDIRTVRAAEAEGVALFPLSDFAVTEPPVNGLVFGYGAITLDDLPEALHRLRHVLT
ncbi:MocR-like pyridoxine biosynthesis transcription factor PdxR [Actinomadura rupiterrae]|uniref:MocR-like pyridoxine biosynthesis transcription factor PdxR n=1 Tax=Actinomadura rupiterrae TaxID=559627 RepID=UPI0020A56A3E|nr:PLP-dependent aminotransferase family protein [Actinomadura rupiterrae]MCP2338744.1 GntR family transcriptional regulator/MocR family aminotransferase [Actinomadura rupiterrae]